MAPPSYLQYCISFSLVFHGNEGSMLDLQKMRGACPREWAVVLIVMFLILVCFILVSPVCYTLIILSSSVWCFNIDFFSDKKNYSRFFSENVICSIGPGPKHWRPYSYVFPFCFLICDTTVTPQEESFCSTSLSLLAMCSEILY